MNRIRQWAPLAAVVGAAAIMAVHGPIPQLSHYHDFADGRTLLGVPHAMDVLSNAAFAAIALWGAWRLAQPAARARLGAAWPGYALFAAALLLTAVGSSYYHLAPDDARLVWDRIPIALACAGLLAGVHAQTRETRHALGLTAALAVLAVASVLWWSFTGVTGVGDLRPYLLLQGAPLVLVPAWQALARSPRRDRIAFASAIGLYVAAKAAELLDRRIFEALGFMSGHTAKHLLAAAASAVILAAVAGTASASEVDLSSTVALEATCTTLAAAKPQALATDEERVAFAICTGISVAKDVLSTAHREPIRMDPAGIGSLRARLESALERIVAARTALERVRSAKPLFVIEPGKWEIDFDGDGILSPFERHFFWVPKRGVPVQPFSAAVASDAYYEATQTSPVIRVDGSDIQWAIAYCDFAEAALNLVLAYDFDPRAQGIVLVDAKRVQGPAYARLVDGIRRSKRLRESLLAETDDDREWIPNPRQHDTAFPLAMDAQTFATWGRLLDELQRLLDGRSLLGGKIDGARPGTATADLTFGLCKPGEGIDVRGLFRKPLPHVDAAELATRCVPVTRALPISGLAKLASESIARNRSRSPGLPERGEWAILRHLYWVN
jgi:hypothetical protein